ncbi:MAG: DinB family protein [Dehalococcoidia bacterium]|nr:MAG: DinB family protein [Dehalococcoidia bacterium]
MVSENITRRRDEYLQLMRDIGKQAPDGIARSVAETQQALMALLTSAPESSVLARPALDEWCLRDLALHAAFTERLISRLVHYMARGSMPPPEDLAGAGIGMMPEGDVRAYADVLSHLGAMNDELLDAVRNLPENPNTEMLVPHLLFGPLNCLEWAGFQRVHDTDHIQHARQILAAVAG